MRSIVLTEKKKFEFMKKQACVNNENIAFSHLLAI